MARYVVLSFEDDEQAEKFVEAMGKQATHGTPFPMDSTLEAMFQKPKRFCEANGCRVGTKGRVQGFSRGRKYGWWVCSVCHLPPFKWGQSLSAVLGCAVDLLRDRQSQNMEREAASDVIEDYRVDRRMDIGRYPDGGKR